MPAMPQAIIPAAVPINLANHTGGGSWLDLRRRASIKKYRYLRDCGRIDIDTTIPIPRNISPNRTQLKGDIIAAIGNRPSIKPPHQIRLSPLDEYFPHASRHQYPTILRFNICWTRHLPGISLGEDPHGLQALNDPVTCKTQRNNTKN